MPVLIRSILICVCLGGCAPHGSRADVDARHEAMAQRLQEVTHGEAAPQTPLEDMASIAGAIGREIMLGQDLMLAALFYHEQFGEWPPDHRILPTFAAEHELPLLNRYAIAEFVPHDDGIEIRYETMPDTFGSQSRGTIRLATDDIGSLIQQMQRVREVGQRVRAQPRPERRRR